MESSSNSMMNSASNMMGERRGLSPSFENIISIFTLITPLTFCLYFILASVFNEDIKAIIYMSGLLIGTIIAWFPLVFMLKRRSYIDESAYCKVINVFPWLASYNVPSYSSYFISFTAVYLIIPMIKNDTFNSWLFALLLIILGVDSIVKLKQKCTSFLGIFLGIIVGSIWSALWVCLFMYTKPDLLYYDMLNGNNKMCSIPSKQSFKCQVYKNGKPVSGGEMPWHMPSDTSTYK